MSRQTELELTAALLKQCRQLLGWSQRELAERAGVHEQTVKYWEGKQGVIAGVAVDLMFKKLAVALEKSEQSNKSPNQRCGARTRKGAPCKAKALPEKTRCKFHGGMSTGPKTAEGRQRIAEAQRRRWAAYRNAA
jgi:transcriptional regulator with XRE-family HTH domain